MREEAVRFGSLGCTVGVVTDPTADGASEAAARPRRPAFLFLNAGVTHHVGPNGLYVRLARALARDGFPSLRFDYSGLGDSGTRADAMPAVESVALETREAMDLLERTRGVRTFVPIGICSGAINAFTAARADPRVVGAVLVNAQMHLHGPDPALAEALHARAMSRHAWRIALRSSFRSKNWKKALGGKLTPGRIASMLVGGTVRAVVGRLQGGGGGGGPAPDPMGTLRELADRGVHLYHLYCEGDEGLDYFHTVLGGGVAELARGERSTYEVIEGANHVFTLRWSQEALVERVRAWAATLPVPAPAGASG